MPAHTHVRSDTTIKTGNLLNFSKILSLVFLRNIRLSKKQKMDKAKSDSIKHIPYLSFETFPVPATDIPQPVDGYADEKSFELMDVAYTPYLLMLGIWKPILLTFNK